MNGTSKALLAVALAAISAGPAQAQAWRPMPLVTASMRRAGLTGGEGSGTRTANAVEAAAGDPSEPAPKKSKDQ